MENNEYVVLIYRSRHVKMWNTGEGWQIVTNIFLFLFQMASPAALILPEIASAAG